MIYHLFGKSFFMIYCIINMLEGEKPHQNIFLVYHNIIFIVGSLGESGDRSHRG